MASNQRYNSLSIAAIAGLLVLLVSAVTMRHAMALPNQCVAYNETCTNSNCTTTDTCVAGELCTGFDSCLPFALETFGSTTTATSNTVLVHTNAQLQPPNPPGFHVWGCLGTSASCTLPTTSSVWTDYGLRSTAASAASTGLRPGRTYTETFYGTYQTASKFFTHTFTTWPGTPPIPTESDGGCNNVTGLCKRNFSWSTSFGSDSTVIYHDTTGPEWNLNTHPRVTTSNIASLTASSQGEVWGAGFGGQILHRNGSGNWNPQTSPTTFMLYSIAANDNTTVWAVGQNGVTLKTDDGGVSWANAGSVSPAVSLLAVTAPTKQAAWAVGSGWVFANTQGTWTQRYNNASTTFQSITTLNNNEVWAVGTNGMIAHTNNGYQIWGSPTPPNWQTYTTNINDNLSSIATLDGTTIWAGGFNGGSGRLYRSTDSGVTWTEIASVRSSTQRVDSINLVNQDEFWFTDATRVGKFSYNNGSPIITEYSQPGTWFGSSVYSLAITKNNEIVVGGEQQFTAEFTMPIGSTPVLFTTNTTAHSVQLDGFAPNTTYYYAVESNGSGLTTGNFGGSFTTPIIDTVDPTITLNTLPIVTRTCPLTISGTANDNVGVTSVVVTIDAAPAITATGTTNWSTSLPCAALNNGTHTVSVVAHDAAGNVSTPATGTFVFDNSVPTVTINPQGPVNTATITLSGSAADNDQVVAVDVSVNGAARQPAAVTSGATAPWAITNLVLNSGVNSITVYARDRAGNEGSAITNVTYNVPTFTLSAAPLAQTTQAGSSALYTITATAVNGFTGTILLSAAGGPPSNNVLFTSPSLTITAPATSAVTTLIVGTNAADISATAYTTTITGVSNTITKTLTVSTTVEEAIDFAVSSLPTSQTVVASVTANYTLNMSGTSTYVMPGGPAPYSFSVGTLPAGVTASFGPVTGNATNHGTATATLSLATTLPVTNTAIVVSVTDGSLTRTVTVGLTVTPQPDIGVTLTSSPNITVTAGPMASAASTTYVNARVTALFGFTGNVNLSIDATAQDSNITATISPSTLTATVAGTDVTINLHADSATVSPHVFALTLRATPNPAVVGVSDKTVSISLTVNPDLTAPVISNIASAPDFNAATISWVTDEPADSSVTVYSDAGLTTPVGTQLTSALCTTTCHSITITPLNPLTTYFYSVSSTDAAYKVPPIPNGNTTTASQVLGAPLTFTTTAAPDLTKPLIFLDQPGAGTTIVGGTTILAHGSDDHVLDRITLTITPLNGSPLVDTFTSCSATTCNLQYSWNSMQQTPFKFPNGDYTIAVQAFSTSGNSTTIKSNIATAVVTVANLTTPPTIQCLSNQVNCQPEATNLVCDPVTHYCTIDIHWVTDQNSTSEVDYGLAVDCNSPQNKTLPDGTVITLDCSYTDNQKYDRSSPLNANPDYTEHWVTLSNLQEGQLYHYRVTSCNISNLCTN